MTRKVIIISPLDTSFSDIVNYTITDDMQHQDIALQYAYNLKLKNISNGYDDLASLNYVVIFGINNQLEVYAGKQLNENQAYLLNEVINKIYFYYKDLKIELGIFDENKKINIINKTYSSMDDLIKENYNIKFGKEDNNARKKI